MKVKVRCQSNCVREIKSSAEVSLLLYFCCAEDVAQECWCGSVSTLLYFEEASFRPMNGSTMSPKAYSYRSCPPTHVRTSDVHDITQWLWAFEQ